MGVYCYHSPFIQMADFTAEHGIAISDKQAKVKSSPHYAIKSGKGMVSKDRDGNRISQNKPFSLSAQYLY